MEGRISLTCIEFNEYVLKLIVLLTATFLGVAAPSHACSVAPAHMYLAQDEVIEHAEWIALAEAISFERRDGGPVYHMRAIEYLKGSGPEEFELPNAYRQYNGDSKQPEEINYYGHTVSKFWLGATRYSNWPDCRIHPGFAMRGQRYLIFGPLDYALGFENVTDEGDLWLQYVRDYLADGTARKPFPIAPSDYFTNAEAIVHVRASWDGSSVDLEQVLLSGPEDNYLKMAYISPLAAFADILDPACHGEFGFPRGQATSLDRVYVFERIPRKDIRFSETLWCVGGEEFTSASISGYGRYSYTGGTYFAVEDGEIVSAQARTSDWVAPFRTSRIPLSNLSVWLDSVNPEEQQP